MNEVTTIEDPDIRISRDGVIEFALKKGVYELLSELFAQRGVHIAAEEVAGLSLVEIAALAKVEISPNLPIRFSGGYWVGGRGVCVTNDVSSGQVVVTAQSGSAEGLTLIAGANIGITPAVDDQRPNMITISAELPRDPDEAVIISPQ